jgi:hypothetical protein
MLENIELDAVIDFIGFSDYWHGHGHCFEENNFIGCSRFSVPIDNTETVKEILEMMLDDINSYWFDIVNEELYRKHKDKIESISNEEIMKALRETIKFGVKDEDQFSDEEPIQTNDDFYDELPQVIGWLHIYEKL